MLDNPIKLYYAAGAVLMLAGVLTAVFGSRAAGAMLVLGGAGMSWFGQTLHEHGWVSLVAVILSCGVAVCIAWERYRQRREAERVADALKETIVAIQPHSDVKRAMCDGSEKRQAAIRPVIDPLKAELRKEGRI